MFKYSVRGEFRDALVNNVTPSSPWGRLLTDNHLCHQVGGQSWGFPDTSAQYVGWELSSRLSRWRREASEEWDPSSIISLLIREDPGMAMTACEAAGGHFILVRIIGHAGSGDEGCLRETAEKQPHLDTQTCSLMTVEERVHREQKQRAECSSEPLKRVWYLGCQ